MSEDKPRSFADDSNDFAFALFGQLRQRPGNLFFSPFSIRTTLCMAEAGARGETAAQMKKALNISSSNEALEVAFAETIQRLGTARGDKYELAVANSLWGQEGSPLLPEYLELIARHYGGTMMLVDFRDALAARARINQWVEDRTSQRIRELIPAGALNADSRLIVVNAIFFKAMWALQFRRLATREEAFLLEGGGAVRVPLMRQHERVRYLQAPGYQAIELMYRGGELSMLVLLPDRQEGLPDLEKTVSAAQLHECVTRMVFREVNFFLPRFKITSRTFMRDELVALGMPLAFTAFHADFSGINGYEPPNVESLFVSAVVHEAVVEVGEEGTEAAAATALLMELGAALEPRNPPPVPVFRADHPFLFVVWDRKSGAILFLGRVADPTRAT